jgi:hypothetical protein
LGVRITSEERTEEEEERERKLVGKIFPEDR